MVATVLAQKSERRKETNLRYGNNKKPQANRTMTKREISTMANFLGEQGRVLIGFCESSWDFFFWERWDWLETAAAEAMPAAKRNSGARGRSQPRGYL